MQTKSSSISRGKVSTNIMVKVALLAAVSYLLTFIRVPLPLFPTYLKLDVAELPALVGGFALSPIAGMVVILIKNLIDFLTKTTTGGVGELSNFIVGSSFVVTASVIYQYNKTRRNAILGVIFGTLAMAALGILSNKYLIFPLYGLPAEWKFMFTTILPFNIIKGAVNSVFVILIYKKIRGILK